MNEIAKVSTPTPGMGIALIPANIREAMELATMMAKGRLVPKDLQNSPADCFLVIEQASRWGMSPFAVAQEVSVIQGKLMHSGKVVAAAVQSCGIIAGRIRYDYAGEGEAREVVVTATLRGEAFPAAVTVRLRDAKTTNQHWAKSPDQMLAYHGARVWARRYAPEVMLGVYAPEEFDTPPAPAQEHLPPPRGPVVEHAAEPTPQPNGDLPLIDPSGKMVGIKVRSWVPAAERVLSVMEDADAVREWTLAMEPHFAALRLTHADLVIAAGEAIARRLTDFYAPEDPADLGEAPGEGRNAG